MTLQRLPQLVTLISYVKTPSPDIWTSVAKNSIKLASVILRGLSVPSDPWFSPKLTVQPMPKHLEMAQAFKFSMQKIFQE